MDSNEVALRKGGEGKGYYERCGAEAGVPALSRIFAMLSEDERRHADALRAREGGAVVKLDHSTTLDGARCLLRHLSVRQLPLAQFSGNLASYVYAMDFEAATARFYGQLAQEAQERWEKELFQVIAAEDEMHFTLIEQIRELFEPSPAVDGVFDAD